jgi:hypothetical protein
MKTEYLLKCKKCGAVMMKEGYLRYGWYLGDQRVEGCPPETAKPQGRAEGFQESPGAKRRGRSPS